MTRSPAPCSTPSIAASARSREALTGRQATCAIVSFRLGGMDGVSVEARKWAWALEQLGFHVVTVAGSGAVDRTVPGLEIDASASPDEGGLAAALDDAALVVVENLCSLPLNPAASDAVARVLTGRRAILHHHDLPWQRARFGGFPPPPTDPAWIHVTINNLSRVQLAEHGIDAVTLRNTFALERVDRGAQAASRAATRTTLEVRDGETLVLQPTRAIP